MWYKILKHLTNYLKANITDVDISQGGYLWEEITSYPAIRLNRAGEKNSVFFAKSDGVFTINLESWVECDDHNPEEGYEALNSLEDKWKGLIESWSYEVETALGVSLISLEVPNITPAVLSARPNLGSQAVLVITLGGGI